MKKKLSIVIIIVAVLMVAAIVALRNYRVNSVDDVCNVGIILPLTGPLEYEGKRLLAAIQYAQTVKANAPLQLACHIEDGKYTVKDSINAFYRLMTQNNIDVWIIYGDLPLMGLKDMLKSTEKPVVCMIGAQELIKGLDTFIHFSGSIVSPARKLAEYANINSIQTASMIYHKEQIGDIVAAEFRKRFELQGGRILAEESFVDEYTDVKTLISKAISRQPDALFVYAYGPSYISILNQIKAQGFKGAVLTDSNVSTVRDKIVNGGDGILYADFDFGLGCYNPETLEFIDVMRRDYCVDASSFSAFMYEAVRVLSNVVNDFGKSPNNVVKGFDSVINYPSIVGTLTYVPDGELMVPIVMKRITGNNVEVIK